MAYDFVNVHRKNKIRRALWGAGWNVTCTATKQYQYRLETDAPEGALKAANLIDFRVKNAQELFNERWAKPE
jgi:hypothetical protein